MPAYELLSKEMGVPVDMVKKSLSAGGSMTAPTSFLADFANLSGPLAKFNGGLAAERKTLGGELSQVKAMAAQVLEAGVQPLTEWLGKETPKVTAWLNGVKTRFGQMGSSLGADWKSGNMGAFGQDLDTILGGGGKYAGDLESLGKAVKGFVDITKNDLIPFGKDLLSVRRTRRSKGWPTSKPSSATTEGPSRPS